MTNKEKQELVSQLLKSKKSSIWGSIINNFIDDINNKSDYDLLKLVSELKDANKNEAEVVKDILQDGYEFVMNFQLPTDFTPTESEGAE